MGHGTETLWDEQTLGDALGVSRVKPPNSLLDLLLLAEYHAPNFRGGFRAGLVCCYPRDLVYYPAEEVVESRRKFLSVSFRPHIASSIRTR